MSDVLQRPKPPALPVRRLVEVPSIVVEQQLPALEIATVTVPVPMIQGRRLTAQEAQNYANGSSGTYSRLSPLERQRYECYEVEGSVFVVKKSHAPAAAKKGVQTELKRVYNEKLAEYSTVSAKLNRHKFMSAAVLQLTTESFLALIQELSVMLNEIGEYTLEESMGGFAV